MAAKTLIDEAGGRGEGANVPEGNFDNEEIYSLPPSSPLVSNSPQYLMSSCLKDTRRGNVLENNLDAAISGLYLMPSCAQALKLSSNYHLKIGLLPFSSKHEEGNFCGSEISAFIEDLSPLSLLPTPLDFISSKRPVEKKSWCWDWPEVGSHFCPIFWWLAIYIIPPAAHNATIKPPRYEDIRSVNKS